MKHENKILSFFIKTLNGMAYGLFATLIIGTIIASFGKLLLTIDNPFFKIIGEALGDGNGGVSYVLQCLLGAGIGIGIAITLKFDALSTIVLAAVGEATAYFSLTGKFVTDGIYENRIKIGDPLTVYFVIIILALLMRLVFKKKTPVDILIIPLFGAICGTILAILIRYPSFYVTYGIQLIVDLGTKAVPLLMGAIVAVVMGMALTAPISSAAIASIIFNPMNINDSTGLLLASGAAIVGCSTQMVGFAIQARKDNKIGMVISIGIGTSMLEFKNILKKPIIWLPTIIASAILGPVSTMWLKLKCVGASSGMGTAGLVGQIGTFSSMGNTWQAWVGVFGLQIIAPMILVFLIDLLFRRLGLIKDGDLKV